MQLAKCLRQLIRHHDMTVIELSKHTSVPVNTLHNWLSGQPPRNLNQVKAVADFFNVTIDRLVFGTEVRIDTSDLPDLLMSGKYEVILRPVSSRKPDFKSK